ncbi:hypothetical protein GCM10017788_02850 [Amycolatopsis acidiphila]|nr:hypothetical protein GCM10017788_02850 [Amycolatopsis acidiphila]
MCEWFPFATTIAAAGYRVVLWDYDRGPAPEPDQAADDRYGSAAAEPDILAAIPGADKRLLTAAVMDFLARTSKP